MEKSKIWVLVALMLALFFFSGFEVQASAIDYNASHATYELYSDSYGPLTRIYHFYLGPEGVTVDESGDFYSFVGDSVVVDLDIFLLRSQFNIDEYYDMYDYLTTEITPTLSQVFNYTDYTNGLTTIQQQVINTLPYVTINGTKHYLSSGYKNSFVFEDIPTDTAVVYGCEVQFKIDYTAEGINSSSTIENFGYTTYSLTLSNVDVVVNGVKYVSTGEEGIIDSIVSWGNIQYTQLFNIYNKLIELKNAITVNLITKLDVFQKEVAENFGISNTWLSDIALWLSDIFSEINFQAERMYIEVQNMHITLKTTIKNAIEGVQAEVGYWGLRVEEKLEEISELLSKGYDNTDANKSNVELDTALSDYSNEEQLVFGDAKMEMSSYNVSNTFDFAVPLISSLSLITTFANSFFISYGDLSTALTVMMSLVFVSVVLGLIRFVRG